ncbi:hypothetical protein CO057_03380 [Candidatus Uhrbacteria bacterium CG_4_9_14_0_2_um_filter_41_50]|uniref:RNA polymerase sigma factor 70 region 4 type 2 domain-containing protein n=1 Tax=Candidatus Uhrbacteria bacterium CG_4_9_14_0_2_um_filter_41_50 TaxID=1975031 RepID=A0A2M8ENS6_9BACT|nr:MAG: hypothetical protein COZ45_02390 [Candidatus Uhrbacteria bacterium CG_4_10_14_3_um_filter_41_21]PIZ54257.1 MAG: hypothetical protein COY24_04575 [Candidatus Uhrbacteria bacterium CG_4_10_14_0_2_um_filter_41_21]PJB84426.1 MAG: hypothetical protein CO086_03660 [Candidatus Uhrbacteria bacterium CG_4_9_14_0_8_um_filter_41_16]PJC24341.1 MAG: hypothetical protein CO057_03380 [Candidatus Uhrbacteria bacterium CG_4_9_14_0_2_um_filter_41_50]PJE75296.1 MAG: hypothetical protein COV03_00825 [Candi
MRHRHKFLLFRVYRFRDTEAYGQLYDFYVIKIRRFISFRIPSSEEAEELTSEVFLRGWEYATASIVKNPGALFYRIAKYVVADFYRSRMQETGLDEAAEIASPEKLISEKLEIKDDSQRLISQLKNLKEEYRDVLVMKYLDEMSIGEIAESLEKTSNNVRVLLHRAKNALKEITSDEYNK